MAPKQEAAKLQVWAGESGEKAGSASARDILRVVFRRKWLILTFFVIACIVSVLRALNAKVTYSSAAEVLISRAQRSSSTDSRMVTLGWDEVINSQVQMAKSRTVIKNAEDRLNAERAEDGRRPIDVVPGNVNVFHIGESNVLSIGYEADSPGVATEVAQALALEYIDYHLDLVKLPDVYDYFTGQIEVFDNRLKLLDAERQSAMEEGAVAELVAQQRAVVDEKREVIGDRNEVDVTIAGIEEQIRQAESAEGNPLLILPLVLSLDWLERSIMQEAHQQYLVALAERDRLLSTYTPRHAEVQAAERNLTMTEGRLGEMIEAARNRVRADLEVLKAKRARYDEILAGLNAEIAAYPRKEAELVRLDRDIRIQTETYQQLWQSLIQIQLSEAGTRDSEVQMIAPAGAPMASSPRDPVRLSLGPLFSLFVGTALAFFLEAIDHSFKSREDVEAHLELPVLASIPELSTGGA